MNSSTKVDFVYGPYESGLGKNLSKSKEIEMKEKTLGDYFLLCVLFCAPTVLLLSILLFL